MLKGLSFAGLNRKLTSMKKKKKAANDSESKYILQHLLKLLEESK